MPPGKPYSNFYINFFPATDCIKVNVFLFKINLFMLFIYFWLCWVFVAVRSFSSCGVRGLLFVAVHGLLIAVASLVAEHVL